jgi:MFS family permease
MARVALAAYGGVLLGIALGFIVGMIAAMVITKSGPGPDGGGAMAAFFFIGPIGGIAGLITGAIIVWKLTADASRMGPVTMSLFGIMVVVMIITAAVAMTPKDTSGIQYPKGMRGALKMEVKGPPAALSAKNLSFQMRMYKDTVEAPPLKTGVRTEGDQQIVATQFPLLRKGGSRFMAVMVGDEQRDVTSIETAEEPNTPTEWSSWQKMDSGLLMRWRIAVERK